jgi:hypothetical protein
MKIFKVIVCVFVIVCVLAGFAFYYNYTSSQIANLTQEKENMIIELQNLNKTLEETHEALNQTREDLEQAKATIKTQATEIEGYIQQIEDEEAKWKRRYEEYPIATEVWIAMKTYGWSDTVCAGIMGNLMAETGGTGTLHLDWDSNGSDGYGLVQWIGSRRNAIKSRYGIYPSVKEQIQFVHDELFGANGVRQQVTINQLDAIMTAETPEESAYAFACYYERCADFARGMRRGFARDAYE